MSRSERSVLTFRPIIHERTGANCMSKPAGCGRSIESAHTRRAKNEDRHGRAGRFWPQTPRWPQEHCRRRGREPRRRQQGVDGSRREAVRHPALDDESRRGARAARRRSRNPDVTDASACRAGRAGHESRQARRDRDPDRRFARRRDARFTRRRRRRARSRWPATRAASTRRTCGSRTASRRAS